MKNYLDLMRDIMENGIDQTDRTGVGTRSVFRRELRFDLTESFPAITTKRVPYRLPLAELIFFLSGSTNVFDLQSMGCNVWNENYRADYWYPKRRFEGDLGRIYPAQWRDWVNKDGKHFDQIQDLIYKLKHNPTDRRLMVCAYNPGELDQMALPACHTDFTCYVDTTRNELSLDFSMRSCDVFLGLPFNITFYATLTHMLAQVCGLKAKELIATLRNTHIYLNHFDQVKEQLSREPMDPPTLWINPEIKDIDGFGMDDLKLIGYQSHPAIKAPMAV